MNTADESPAVELTATGGVEEEAFLATISEALAERGPADTILALALVHHLAIGNNTPLPKVAEWLASLCKTLIIEFVPKGDSQVERLLASREDVFDGYTREGFEKAFEVFFEVVHRREVSDSRRTLYAMRARRGP